MKRKMLIAGALLVALAGIIWAQNDPFYIVQNSRGLHITAGTQFPALATTGMNPGDGQLHVQLISGATANSVLWMYSTSAAAWIPVSPIGAGVGSVPSTLATNAVDVADSIWGGTGELIFEGATPDANENEIRTADPTGGVATFLLPDQAAAADIYPIMWSLLATNSLQTANSVWFDTNLMVFEGATPDANESMITANDTLTGSVTLAIPIDNADWAGTGNLLVSVMATNAPDAQNSIWGVSNSLHFEGATVDAHEHGIQSSDATVGDQNFFIPDNAAAANYALVFSDLVTNAIDANDSVWLSDNMIMFEGATGGDANEIQLEAEDATADPVYLLPDSPTGPSELLYTGVEDAVDDEFAGADNWMEPVHARNPVKIWFREAPWYGAEQAGAANTGLIAVCNVVGAPNIVYSFRDAQVLELDAKGNVTACGPTWAVADGMGLHSDAAADEGHELTFGIEASSPAAYTVGTDPPFYAQIRFAVADIALTDQVYFGFRIAGQAYDDGALANYTDFFVVGIGDLANAGGGAGVDGDVFTQTQLNTTGINATDCATNTPEWVNNGVHTIRVNVDAGGVATFLWDGLVCAEAPVFEFDDDVLIPFFWFLSDTGANDPDIDIVTLEHGVQ